MADDLVNTSADALGESGIVQRRRIGVTLDTSIVADLVQLVSCHSRLDVASDEVQDFTSKLNCQLKNRSVNSLCRRYACAQSHPC